MPAKMTEKYIDTKKY